MDEPVNSTVNAQPHVIESASASTACQTNNSKFAYALTGGVLGVIALIAVGITLLLFAAFATMSSSSSADRLDESYRRYYDWDDDWSDDDFGWSEYTDEFDELQAL